MTPEARMADVANALAEWINKTPLAPNEIHAVYAAHVLLCSLIEGESALRGEVAKLQQQRLDDHRAWHELNERRAEAEAALADLRHQLQEWLAANAPGGWIDGLRKSVGERDTLLQQVANAKRHSHVFGHDNDCIFVSELATLTPPMEQP